MKKCILTALLSLLYFLSLFPRPLAHSAQADSSASVPIAGSYACILDDNTYFYAARDEKRGLFVLPKTYFVKVLDVSDDFCKIEYLYDDSYVQKLVGYAKTKELTPVSFTPERPYLYYLFEVSYRIEDNAQNTDGFLNQLTVTCAYYGDFKIGSESYCYVLRGNEFGYIPKPTDISYDENTEYADHLLPETPPETNEESPTPTSQSSPAQIAILIALCILVPLLAALILKPPHRPPYDSDE